MRRPSFRSDVGLFRSAVDNRHHGLVVAGAGHGAFRGCLVDPCEVFAGEFDRDGGGVFFELLAAFGAGDGYEVVSLRQDPGKGELRGRNALFPCNLLDAFDQVEVPLEVFALKAG